MRFDTRGKNFQIGCIISHKRIYKRFHVKLYFKINYKYNSIPWHTITEKDCLHDNERYIITHVTYVYLFDRICSPLHHSHTKRTTMHCMWHDQLKDTMNRLEQLIRE